MKVIAFDVMGNDNGVRPGVEAALLFTQKHLNYSCILVGDAEEIRKYARDTERIKIVDVKKVASSESATTSSRNERNSMTVAIKLVKDGRAEAVMSCGSSAAYLTYTTLLLRRIKGFKRPAFMPIIPTIVKDQKFVLLDVGANLETTSEMLYQWAILGSVFSKSVLQVENPRVGIVNIATEDERGKEYSKEANKRLKAEKVVNYMGFIEPRELLAGQVDVAVVDGYGGNLILKNLEGTVLNFLKLIKNRLNSKVRYKISALLAKGAFNAVKETLDYRSVGAAFVIGLNGLVLKSHGSSDKKAIMGAFGQLDKAIRGKALSKLKAALDDQS